MQVIPVAVGKEIGPSDDLAGLVASSARVEDGDVLVVAQKAVSKAEGRTVDLSSVEPSLLAEGIAAQYGKDPRVVELVLSESGRIVRMRDGVLIVETRGGIVCANAGIDESNVAGGHATLLPEDPDASARGIRRGVLERTGMDAAVIVSDTFGRAFRSGQTNCAIGVSGMEPVLDYSGTRDAFGRILRVTAIAVADELASAAELVMQKTLGCPAALVRGYRYGAGDGTAAGLLRPRGEDLFR